MTRGLVHALTILLAAPCLAQRAPTSTPAPSADSLRTAWAPESITHGRPERRAGLDSSAVIRFHNGARFATGLWEVTFLGILPSRKAPYVVLRGRGCTGCDANLSIYVLNPVGPPVTEATTTRYWTSGREKDRETGKFIRKSRAFIGQCLPDSNEGVIWYDSLADDHGGWQSGLSRAQIVADTVASDLRIPPPAIRATLELVRLGKCREIPSTDELNEP